MQGKQVGGIQRDSSQSSNIFILMIMPVYILWLISWNLIALWYCGLNYKPRILVIKKIAVLIIKKLNWVSKEIKKLINKEFKGIQTLESVWMENWNKICIGMLLNKL